MMRYSLSDFGMVKVSGQDANKLLQGQLTCDVNVLQPASAQLAAHCNQQGRVVSLFYLAQWQDAYCLVMPKTLIPIAIKALKKYAIFYKVSIEAISDVYITGNTDVNVTPNAHVFSLSNCHLYLELSSAPLDAATPPTPWLSQLIELGIPTLYPETSAMFLPHELNLPALGAVSFDKGCYTGQEIIARMHYRGKLKKALRVTKLEGTAPLRGTDVDQGCIVDVVQVTDDKYVALLLLSS